MDKSGYLGDKSNSGSEDASSNSISPNDSGYLGSQSGSGSGSDLSELPVLEGLVVNNAMSTLPFYNCKYIPTDEQDQIKKKLKQEKIIDYINMKF
jgi:hypothetical protein